MITIQERNRVLMSNYYTVTCETCKYVIKCVLEGGRKMVLLLKRTLDLSIITLNLYNIIGLSANRMLLLPSR